MPPGRIVFGYQFALFWVVAFVVQKLHVIA